jgi:hypothetical protein
MVKCFFMISEQSMERSSAFRAIEELSTKVEVGVPVKVSPIFPRPTPQSRKNPLQVSLVNSGPLDFLNSTSHF